MGKNQSRENMLSLNWKKLDTVYSAIFLIQFIKRSH